MRILVLAVVAALAACAVGGGDPDVDAGPSPFPVERGTAPPPPQESARQSAPPEGARPGGIDFGQWRQADPAVYGPAFQNQVRQRYSGRSTAQIRADLEANGFACTVHSLDAKVGGAHRMSFRNFTTGASHSFGGKYLELVPGERLRYTDTFDDPNLPGEMQVTVTLKQVSVGTEVNIVQEGIPDAIPAEACILGWQQSLRNLARLVEPEINQ